MQTVLLTGVSGYIALHCAAELLRAGYQVRGSVRSQRKAEKVQALLAAHGVDTGNLSFVEIDLESDEGWADAARGCDYLMHVASPLSEQNPKDEQTVIGPAVLGTLRAMQAAHKAGVKRVVVTSSTLAMSAHMKTGKFGPADWTDLKSSRVNTYAKSKTMAEMAARDFLKDIDPSDPMELVTVHPSAVTGPPLDPKGRAPFVSEMLAGKMPLVPKMDYPFVDVRDVAQLHVRAMEHPDVAGMRIIASPPDPQNFVTIAQMLNTAGYPKPSARTMPTWLMRLIGLFDREMKGMLSLEGAQLSIDNSATVSLFDWQPIPFATTVLDAAKIVEAA